jgi:hypothetical protein
VTVSPQQHSDSRIRPHGTPVAEDTLHKRFSQVAQKIQRHAICLWIPK